MRHAAAEVHLQNIGIGSKNEGASLFFVAGYGAHIHTIGFFCFCCQNNQTNDQTGNHGAQRSNTNICIFVLRKNELKIYLQYLH